MRSQRPIRVSFQALLGKFHFDGDFTVDREITCFSECELTCLVAA